LLLRFQDTYNSHKLFIVANEETSNFFSKNRNFKISKTSDIKRLDFITNFRKTCKYSVIGTLRETGAKSCFLSPPPFPLPPPPLNLGAMQPMYVQASGISQCSVDPWPRLPSIYISQLKGQSHEISLMGINSREACIF
jgi:hypothetical protein